MQPPPHVPRNRLQHASAEKHIYLHVLLIYFPLPFFKLRQLQRGRETSPGGLGAAAAGPPHGGAGSPFGFLRLQGETTKLRAALERPTSPEYPEACFSNTRSLGIVQREGIVSFGDSKNACEGCAGLQGVSGMLTVDCWVSTCRGATQPRDAAESSLPVWGAGVCPGLPAVGGLITP